jgi:hypothetical protein
MALSIALTIGAGSVPALAFTGDSSTTTPSAAPADDYAVQALCDAGMGCKGGSPWSADGIVSTDFPLSTSGNCWDTTSLTVTNLGEPAKVYVLDPSGFTYPDGKMMIYQSELAGGFSTTLPVTQKPTAYVVAVASIDDPSMILYASSVQTPTVCIQQTYTPPARPYDTPVVRYKVKGCKDTRIELTLGSPLPQGVVSVQLFQKGFSPDDMSMQVVSLSARYQWQRLTLVMPIKNVPVFFTAYDNYGTIIGPVTVMPPKGCRTTYDPATVVPPMGK